MQKAVNAYMETTAVTTSQGEALIMLYDGAIKFLTRAKIKIEERDYAEKGILLSKAIDIINELDSSLNMQKGGELADNLHKLYFYCNTRILNANMKMDNRYIDEVIRILAGLRDAYKQIIHGAPSPGENMPQFAVSSAPLQPQAVVAEPVNPSTPLEQEAQEPARPQAAPAQPSQEDAKQIAPPPAQAFKPVLPAFSKVLAGANAYKQMAIQQNNNQQSAG